MKLAALAVTVSTLAEALDLPLPARLVAGRIGFWNRVRKRLAMLPNPVDIQTRDKILRVVRQIAFGVVVALLFVIGGLAQIWGMLP